MMRAVLVDVPGGPEQMRLGDFPMPGLVPGGLLVRVHATALNRADLLQRAGKYPPPVGASPILGLEVAGVVEEVGEESTGWTVGDRVCGLLPGGGYAEYVALPAGMAMHIPKGLSFEEAAAIPEVYLTAFQALCWLGELEEGQNVLIHAGASGVGTAAIQVARTEKANVFVTASAAKHTTCLKLGAVACIDYQSENFAERIATLTGGHGVELILDFIGAPYFEQNVRALALDGRIVLLALMGGATLEPIHIGPFFRKRAHLIASTLRNRSLSYKMRLTADFVTTMLPLFAAGHLQPVIDTIFDWTDVQEAHRRMEANANVGKIVLRVGDA